jgi:hypothetical protein
MSLGALAFQFSDITPGIREWFGRLPGQQWFLGLGASLLAGLLMLLADLLLSAWAREPRPRKRKPHSHS